MLGCLPRRADRGTGYEWNWSSSPPLRTIRRCYLHDSQDSPVMAVPGAAARHLEARLLNERFRCNGDNAAASTIQRI